MTSEKEKRLAEVTGRPTRRGILDVAQENPVAASRPLRSLEAEIDAAIGEAMAERESRSRGVR